ncbi:MAG: TatD family hydrolase, partial [Gammaproteobacteria bacterium]|nr:TatD family hydrolase [Gammaproteobacteria bacterium]
KVSLVGICKLGYREKEHLATIRAFGGVILLQTLYYADELRSVVKKLPLDRLLIETDAPYLAPVPHRGKTNQPAYVTAVAEAVAQVKGIAIAELAQHTTENFYQLFSAVKKVA